MDLQDKAKVKWRGGQTQGSIGSKRLCATTRN
jgi:hypothetical protein